MTRAERSASHKIAKTAMTVPIKPEIAVLLDRRDAGQFHARAKSGPRRSSSTVLRIAVVAA
jgi:hypothetical protein